MKDKCGREIEVGDIVDWPCDSIMTGVVIEVSEGGVALPGGVVSDAFIAVSLPSKMNLRPGFNAPCYLIKKSKELKEPKKR